MRPTLFIVESKIESGGHPVPDISLTFENNGALSTDTPRNGGNHGTQQRYIIPYIWNMIFVV